MKRIIHFSTLIIVVCCFCFFSFSFQGLAQSQAEKEVPLKIEVDKAQFTAELEKKIPQLMEKGLIPGLSIAVIRDGKLFWTRGFGIKDTKTKKPVTEKTVFEAASLSKPVFAYAVLKLVEKGVLDLDKPLMQYVPESYIKEKFSGTIIKDKRLQKITARMVLSHCCGFPNWRQGELKILFDPGEKFSYSGEGFVFLQRVVEKLTGKRLKDFMRETVFKPLGMTGCSYVWEPEFDEQGAAAHKYLKSSGQRKGSRGNAAASLKTTAADYARFIMAIMNEKGLKKETIREMLTPRTKPEKTEFIFWGLGLGLQHTSQGKAYWHWGDNGDFKAFVTAFKKEKLGVVYFANCYLGLSIAEELVQMAIGGEYPVITSKLMGYDRCDSPRVQLIRTYLNKGIDEVIKKLKAMKKNPAYKEIVSEKGLRRLGSDLQGIEDKDAVLKVSLLNLEAHPESCDTHKDLARAYLEKGDIKQAKILYNKALELNKDIKLKNKSINWALEFIKGLENPVKLPVERLKTMVGDYGERHIKLKDGSLYYFRDNAPTKEYKKLIPISADTFIMEHLVYFRLRFVFDEKGVAKKVIGMYEWGNTDESVRDKIDSTK